MTKDEFLRPLNAVAKWHGLSQDQIDVLAERYRDVAANAWAAVCNRMLRRPGRPCIADWDCAVTECDAMRSKPAPDRRPRNGDPVPLGDAMRQLSDRLHRWAQRNPDVARKLGIGQGVKGGRA